MRLGHVLGSLCAVILLTPGLATAGTIKDWKTHDLIVGDKDFHLVSFSANNASNTTKLGNTTVSASNIVPDLYTLTIGDGAHAIVSMGPWTGEIVYTVKITDPLFWFREADLDSTHIGAHAVITESITGAFVGSPLTLTSTNGSQDHSIDHGVVLDKATFLTIDEKFNISARTAIVSVQNTFTQMTIPEPGSLSVWAVGLVGMGFIALKRRKAKSPASV